MIQAIEKIVIERIDTIQKKINNYNAETMMLIMFVCFKILAALN